MSEIPLYRQLFVQFRDWIASGRLAHGERLPSTRDMAGLLGLNRSTVSAAYELLEAEGLIQGHVGKGSFVTGQTQPAGSGVYWDRLLESSDRFPTPLNQPSSAAISFATSRPAESLFPVDEVEQTCREVLAGPQAGSILQLGSPGGYPPLRDYLFAEARREGIARSQDDILITSGCQQGLDLVQRVLVHAGDTVVVEDPIYPGVKNLLLRAGAHVVGIPVGPQGIDLDHLRRALEQQKPKVLVVTPNFQNPTGSTIPLATRRAILTEAGQAGVVIIENDAYGELRYEGEPVPPLKQLDESGNTILLRSFSKIAFPGLRVGWVIGPRQFIGRLAEAKQLADLHTDHLSQAVLLRFAESGRLAAHKQRMIAAGTERLGAVLAACERMLPAGTRFTHPEGGMNLWVRLPAPLDAAELLGRAERAGVTYAPGRYFEVSHHEPGSLRLSFAGLSPNQIREGVEILGQLFTSELEQLRASRRWEPAPAMV
ncbi:MAG TPA: PLP-dependent aminotransferase family protein [Bryobacteraceae bacterium]|nr:PLP-dependent aminotransferase family protein [Bryobacteraceae bacterium]